jgi:hypothetical protein
MPDLGADGSGRIAASAHADRSCAQAEMSGLDSWWRPQRYMRVVVTPAERREQVLPAGMVILHLPNER